MRGCRWPFGDPKETGFRYCGDPVSGGGPYCPCHTSLSVIPDSRLTSTELSRLLYYGRSGTVRVRGQENGPELVAPARAKRASFESPSTPLTKG
ncbi:GcrA family cell cycle regulator [Gluconobacter morbifer]|uniref:GcrA family cell cycle regulator n=1 Tax=Gluconobacter morbifer TaxID=479935 RepID=UPI000A066EBA